MRCMAKALQAGSQTGPRLFRDLAVVLVLLVVSDGILTEFVLADGLGREANPFVVHVMESGLLVPLKILGAVLAVLMLGEISRRQPRVAMAASLVAVITYTAILYWNLAVVCFSAA